MFLIHFTNLVKLLCSFYCPIWPVNHLRQNAFYGHLAELTFLFLKHHNLHFFFFLSLVFYFICILSQFNFLSHYLVLMSNFGLLVYNINALWHFSRSSNSLLLLLRWLCFFGLFLHWWLRIHSWVATNLGYLDNILLTWWQLLLPTFRWCHLVTKAFTIIKTLQFIC